MDINNYQYFNNSGYRNTRNTKKTLVVCVDETTQLNGESDFSIDLFEPIIIDKQSEVYLDTFISFNSNISHLDGNMAFCLKINEFKINSNGAANDSGKRNTLYNSIIIPNEHSTISNNHSAIIHKAKKFNYICDINPCTLSKITGRITNLLGNPIYYGSPITSNLIKYNKIFSLIITGGVPTNISNAINGQTFTLSTSAGLGGLTGSPQGVFLVTHTYEAKTIHFALKYDANITLAAGGTITFNTGDGGAEVVVTIQVADILIEGKGKFIAEFLIVSTEK